MMGGLAISSTDPDARRAGAFRKSAGARPSSGSDAFLTTALAVKW